MKDWTNKLLAKAERLRKIEKGKKEEKERKKKEKTEKEKQVLLSIIPVAERICLKFVRTLNGNFIKEKDTFYSKESGIHNKNDFVLQLRGKDGEWKKINIWFSSDYLEIVTRTRNKSFKKKSRHRVCIPGRYGQTFRPPNKYCQEGSRVFYDMSFSKFTKERFAKILKEFCESIMTGD